ncbi:MAG: hypothetical protein IJK72_00545 [Mycoplasma sp.]|nr:hypothetical protein [Mycoplasma sp.]
MYSLKNVFGIISFETKYIKITVAEISKNETHCLYFKKVTYPGCDINFKLNDFNGTKAILTNELIKVDSFIGIKVKRYVLNIPNLPINMTSQTISNDNFKSEEDIYKYIDAHPYYPGTICIKKQILGYVVNNQLIKRMPNQTDFSVKCLNCFINKNFIEEYENLFNKLFIRIIDFYINAFEYKDTFSANASNALLIDIYEKQCNLIEYNKEHEIVYAQTINLGTDWFLNQLVNKLEIDPVRNVEQLIQSIKYTASCTENPVVANYFKDKYLRTKQLKLEEFKKICLSTVIKQINKLDAYLIDKQFDEIKIQCNNKFNEIYSLACDLGYLKIKNVNIEIDNETILGIEDEYISNLVHILKDLNQRYELTKDMKLTSIDPFFSEDISRSQFHKNIMIKLGIQSTKMWAKLGDGGE